MPRDSEANEELRAESRKRIIAAARELFARRGYFTCKVTDVARAAHMSPGNVYWYFKSKDDLLREVLAEGFIAQDELLVNVANLPGNSQTRIRALVTEYIAYYSRNSDFIQITLSLLSHSGIGFFHTLGLDSPQIGARFHTQLTQVLAQATRENPDCDTPPHELAQLLFAFLNGLAVTYGRQAFSRPSPTLESALLRLLGYTDAV
ncbi:MAG: TetR/AcrR family transcriptional regulator [Anaerolineae bacterium]|nr:TetR/AcrR family transcriptional regulator [Anaerolineae bacterium]